VGRESRDAYVGPCRGDRRRRSGRTDVGRRVDAGGIDVAIVERRAGQELDGSRSGGLHSRSIEVLDQRGIADRFLAEGKATQALGYAGIPLDISDFPSRYNYTLALWQKDFERILAGWISELSVPIIREREVTGFAQDDTGVDVELSDGQSVRADYLVGATADAAWCERRPGSTSPGGMRQPAG
jgi:2-polyprenyl-6-methoxyphenol hydroxylase-like FAD-dependent oxidoreductase